MKKILSVILALLMCAVAPSVVNAKNNNEFGGNCKSVMLMSINDKQVLYEKDSKLHVSPASVTKIMSILLIAEAIDNGKINLSDKVSASANAVSMGGSQIWLEVGETMTVEELLKAVIVASANDACTALGEFVAGSSSSFVDMMNKRAKELGLKDSNFENCTGLDDDTKNHYSCAYDLAVISCEVMKHSLVKDYTTIWLDSLRNGKTELNNTNKLVNTYNGITGLKTGTTSNAGFCVAATASRDGLDLVAVVLGSDTSKNRFDTAAQLLDYGFSNYSSVKPKIDKMKVKCVKVKNGVKKEIIPKYDTPETITLPKGSAKLTYKYKIYDEISSPLKKNQSLGYIELYNNDKCVSKLRVYASEEIKKIDLITILKQLILNI